MVLFFLGDMVGGSHWRMGLLFCGIWLGLLIAI
jgi:hypothetical protein